MYNNSKEVLKRTMKVRELTSLPHEHLTFLVKENGVRITEAKDHLDRDIDYIECASIIEHTVIINVR